MFTRDRAVRRTLALAQCSLLVLATVGAQAHRALVRHGYCSEHGELIHPDEEAPAPDAAPMDRDTLAKKPPPLRGAHGCAMLQFLAQPIAVSCACFAAPSSPQPAASAVTRSAVDHASIPLLHQSPKHSPPHA